MVARVNSGKSISKALNYNEHKVQQGRAEVLYASGFIKDADKMTFYDKMNQFKRLTSLNEKALTNTLHVSLNFNPAEKLSNDDLSEIANIYMAKIGFANQPYLVYRHYDAGHPHIHIVSTNIQSDGKRISMHNLGRNQSEVARKEIEIEFGLIKASKKSLTVPALSPIQAQKVIYGKVETRRAIANVLATVLPQYKYASLPELNAVLKLYNVVADRGDPGSNMYKRRGLVYRVLDSTGNKVGLPIKASAFYMNGKLGDLEKRFAENAPLKNAHKRRFQTSLKWILDKRQCSLDEFVARLELQNISTVIRRGKIGVVYGITFVDHNSKCVFNGSDLGKEFAAKSILEKCPVSLQKPPSVLMKSRSCEHSSMIPGERKASPHHQPEQARSEREPHFVQPPQNIDVVPYQFTRKRKRKRKRISH